MTLPKTIEEAYTVIARLQDELRKANARGDRLQRLIDEYIAVNRPKGRDR